MVTKKLPSSRTVEVNGTYVMSPNSALPSDYNEQVLDSQWTKNAFLLNDLDIGDLSDRTNRYYSSAESKFTDGRLGCNIGINAKPQFTRYSDIRSKGRNNGRNDVGVTAVSGNHGMGRYYSEAIDDPSQTIYMRFGVPQFSGMMAFLSRAYDADMVSLARTGRATGLLYNVGKLFGTVTAVTAFPQLAAMVMMGKALSWVFSKPTSKFYTVKPTMHTYWASVESLVNNIAVTRGLLPRVMSSDGDGGDRLGQPYRIDSEQVSYLATLMPEVFGSASNIGGVGTDNYINVSSIVNRAQRTANQIFLAEYQAANNTTASDFTGFLKRGLTGKGQHSTYITTTTGNMLTGNLIDGYQTISARLNNFFMLGEYKLNTNSNATEQNPQAQPKQEDTADTKYPDVGKPNPFSEQFLQNLDAEFRDGAQFAVFKVDHTGATQEAFGNSVQESDLAAKINGISSTARQLRFTMSDGNMTGTGIEEMVRGAVGGAVDVLKGVADGVTLGFSNVLAGLGGSGYIDIPKHWQSSSATLPRSSYTIKLISPYGNVVSQIQNIYIPLCMILAGTLPLSTGKASYTSPYLCQLYDRGRCQVQNGMIEALSISRGTSNLAFNTRGNPLAIDVTFSVVDLSSIMHMPISSGGLFSTDTNMDSDNIMSDYIAVLAGQDLYTQLYAVPKLKLDLAKQLTKASRLFSPAAWAATVHDAIPSVISNVIEGANRGSAVIGGNGFQQ